MTNVETPLHEQKCVPCKEGTAPLDAEQIRALYAELGGPASKWQVVDNHNLVKVYTFEDYPSSVKFTDRVAAVADRADHHPSILLEWGKVTVTIWTHKVNGLTENDFVIAAKADKEQ